MDAKAPVSDLEIVYFGAVDWGYTWQRSQQLAVRLARHGRLLYVDPLGLRAPRWGDWRRLARRVREAASRPAAAAPSSVTVHRPLAYWPFPASRKAHRLNGQLLSRVASAWLRGCETRSPILWAGVPSPAVGEAIARLRVSWPSARLVYDCVDDVPAFGGGRPWVTETEAALASSADLVWAASRALFARLRGFNAAAQVLPNAADTAHFRRAVAEDLPLPPDLAAVRPPRLAYVGEVAPWVDLELIGDVADANPQASIVLIGPVHDDARTRALARHPHVHVLGRRPYADLPAYLRHMTACLLPFARTPLTEAASPIKLYEYLAAGRAVVSTPLPEVEAHADVVTIAGRAEFAAAVGRVMASAAAGSPAETQRRLARASEHDWDRRVEVVLDALRRRDVPRAGVDRTAVRHAS